MSGLYFGERVVTIDEAAQRAGVGRRTIYNWLAAGKLQHVRTAGGQVRIREASLWVTQTACAVEAVTSTSADSQT